MKGLCSTGTMTGFDPSNNHLLEGKDLLPPRLKRMAHKPCAAGSWTWGCCFFGAPPGIATIYLLFGFHFPQESSAVCCTPETMTRAGVWGGPRLWSQSCSRRFGCREMLTKVAIPFCCFGVNFAYFRQQSLWSWNQAEIFNCTFDTNNLYLIKNIRHIHRLLKLERKTD